MLLRHSYRLAGGCATGVGIAMVSHWLSHGGSSSSSSSSEEQAKATQLVGDFQRKHPSLHIRRTSTGEKLDAEAQPSLPQERPVFVGIAGGTGSGKTTVAAAITKRLIAHGDRVCHISHDSYYQPLGHLSVDERNKSNFDHPDALDTALMIEHLQDLKAGRPVKVPVYDFTTHTRLLDAHEEKAPAQVILVEGILIYANPQLRDLLDIKIFVDTDSDVRFIRRLKRDITERGRDYASVITQYMSTVRPMHNQFVEPSKRYADVIIPTGLNSVALEMVIARLEQILDQARRIVPQPGSQREP